MRVILYVIFVIMKYFWFALAQYMVDFYKKPAVLSHTFETLRRICACMALAKFETKSYNKFICPWVPQEIRGAFILPKFVF